MKTITYFISGLVLCLIILFTESSCLKRGEDDPALSLRSRRGRIAGKWKVTKITYTLNFVRPPTVNFKSISGENGTYQSVTYGGWNTYNNVDTINGQYTWEITFGRFGKFSHKLVVDGETQIAEGNWSFPSRRDSMDLKLSYLDPQGQLVPGIGLNAAFADPFGEGQIYIRELRHKKMVLASTNNFEYYPNYEYVLEAL